MSSYRPLRFLDASARADEIVANYKLGIGTHSQSSEVHVVADAPEIRVQDEVSEVTETALRITADGGAVSFQSGVDFTNDSKGDFKFESMLGATTHMTIDGSTGNLGIGTTNPEAILHVMTSGGSDGIVVENNGSGTESWMRVMPHMTEGSFNPLTGTGDSALIFSTDRSISNEANTGLVIAPWSENANGIKILENGNVGIGTTSPVSILHVRGIGQTSQTSFDTSQTLGASIFAESSDSVPGSGGSLVLGTYQGKFAAIKADIKNGTNNTVGHLHFMTRNATTDATLTNRMTILNTGNVGIGTVNPLEKFHLYGSPMIQHETIYNVGGSQGWYKLGTWNAASATGGSRLKISLLGAEGYDNYQTHRGGETIIYASINNNNDTNASNMSGSIHAYGDPVITQAKFKQVGTDRSIYEIHAYVETYTRHSMKIECTNTTTFTRALTSSSDPGANSSTVQAALFTHVVNNSGHVGIGTKTPLQPLHVKGNGQNPVIYMSDPSNNRYSSGFGTHHVNFVGQRLDFYNGDSGANGTSLGSSHIRMSINASGHVGIATTDPQTTLDVRSNALLGEYGSSGFYNGYGRCHVRGYTNTPIILENIGTNTSGIGNFTNGMSLCTQGGTIDLRCSSGYNGDMGIAGSHIVRFSNGGDRIQIYRDINGSNPYFYYNSSGNYGTYSDRRGKKNIQTLNVSESVQYVKNLNPVSFNYYTETSDVTPQAGFIAQEVLGAETNPCQTKCVVSGHETYDPDDVNSPNLGVGMQSMIPMLVQALQNALERIEALENNA